MAIELQTLAPCPSREIPDILLTGAYTSHQYSEAAKEWAQSGTAREIVEAAEHYAISHPDAPREFKGGRWPSHIRDSASRYVGHFLLGMEEAAADTRTSMRMPEIRAVAPFDRNSRNVPISFLFPSSPGKGGTIVLNPAVIALYARYRDFGPRVPIHEVSVSEMFYRSGKEEQYHVAQNTDGAIAFGRIHRDSHGVIEQRAREYAGWPPLSSAAAGVHYSSPTGEHYYSDSDGRDYWVFGSAVDGAGVIQVDFDPSAILDYEGVDLGNFWE